MLTSLNFIMLANPNKKMRRKSCINFTKKLKSPDTHAVPEEDGKKPRKRFDRYSDSQMIFGPRNSNTIPTEAEEDNSNKYDQEVEKLMKQVSKMTTEELNGILLTEDDSVVDCILNQTRTVS